MKPAAVADVRLTTYNKRVYEPSDVSSYANFLWYPQAAPQIRMPHDVQPHDMQDSFALVDALLTHDWHIKRPRLCASMPSYLF